MTPLLFLVTAKNVVQPWYSLFYYQIGPFFNIQKLHTDFNFILGKKKEKKNNHVWSARDDVRSLIKNKCFSFRHKYEKTYPNIFFRILPTFTEAGGPK